MKYLLDTITLVFFSAVQVQSLQTYKVPGLSIEDWTV
jgi:hypothetical protein